jgi:DNA-binding protein HU-beta
MTRNDIAVELCKRNPDLLRSAALNTVDNIIDILSESFARGESVYLRGFCTMEVKTAKARKARNMATGAPVMIPAHRTVKLNISKKLKNQINK